jgi:hypothetical protein
MGLFPTPLQLLSLAYEWSTRVHLLYVFFPKARSTIFIAFTPVTPVQFLSPDEMGVLFSAGFVDWRR